MNCGLILVPEFIGQDKMDLTARRATFQDPGSLVKPALESPCLCIIGRDCAILFVQSSDYKNSRWPSFSTCFTYLPDSTSTRSEEENPGHATLLLVADCEYQGICLSLLDHGLQQYWRVSKYHSQPNKCCTMPHTKLISTPILPCIPEYPLSRGILLKTAFSKHQDALLYLHCCSSVSVNCLRSSYACISHCYRCQ